MRQDVGAWTGTGGTADVASNWTKMRVVEVRHPRNYAYEGLTIAELAEATGKHPMDAVHIHFCLIIIVFIAEIS